MIKFLTRRLLQGLVVIWGVITLLFAIRSVAPGDPVDLVAPRNPNPEARARIRADLGLDDPIYVQYLEYLQDMVTLDFGFSYHANREVSTIVLRRVPATIELAIAATIVAVVIAIPLGIISATRRNEPADYSSTMFSLLGISTPNFWLGLMLIFLFGVQIDLFPTARRPVGFYEAVANGSPAALLQWAHHITLPAITLGTYFTAMITRLTRSGMLEELGKPYVTATEAKGLPRVLIRYKHVLRNTLIPIVTVLGLQLGTLIGGAVVTETVFNWPGLGSRLIQAIGLRDWPVIQGIVILIATSFVLINIGVDSLYAYLNPQVRDE